ncbi:MAG: hypothetical protein QXG97_03330, partial [Nitrososphaerota archaeon]
MSDQTNNDVYLEWLESAEESIKKGDYETAANHLRRVAHYFMLQKDTAKFKEFTRKTGDYYYHAAEKLRGSDQHLKTVLLYIKAAQCYKENGDHASAVGCDLAIRAFYASSFKSDPISLQGSTDILKRLGDYFIEEKEFEKARECYETAARKAVEEGKPMLAAGFYSDAGDCSRLLMDVPRAADEYASAADNYFKAEKYLEASWLYNLSGFLLISLKRFGEARFLARKA